MPNWTENDITFVCKTKEGADQLKSLLESKEEKFDFNNITPMPIEIKETVSGFAFIRSCGIADSMSNEVIFSFIALSIL